MSFLCTKTSRAISCLFSLSFPIRVKRKKNEYENFLFEVQTMSTFFYMKRTFDIIVSRPRARYVRLLNGVDLSKIALIFAFFTATPSHMFRWHV